jgi:hypothetical protein
VTGLLAPGYRRQRFTVSISYPDDGYEPFTTDDVADALRGLSAIDLAITVTHDTAEDEP